MDQTNSRFLTLLEKILVEMSGYLEQVYDVQNTEDMLQFVEDRNFNDCRYHITSDKLKLLDGKKKTSFEDGLKRTIESGILITLVFWKYR